MKIIHTADIHLDSPLSGVKDSKRRRFELLTALANMSEYANNNGVQAIIVAGDLFDDKYTSAQTVESVISIVNDSKADWFVLKGNHGDNAPYEKLRQRCPSVKLFGENWTYYNYGGVTICGRELGFNDLEYWQKLSLDSSRFNVLVLHGDIDDDSYGYIDKKAIASSAVNYVALGHRHSLSECKFGRIKGCYSGVLEARGFDETEPTGFIVIDTDSGKVKFQNQAVRSVVTVKIDVTDVMSDIALKKKIYDSVSQESSKNYLNAVFYGQLQQGLQLKMIAEETLKDRFFALRIEDNTVPSYDLEKIAQEVSLRGEFVKLTNEQISDERLRGEIIKFGLNVLAGEL